MSENRKVKIGVVGCGVISGIYLKTLTTLFKNTEVIAVCDIIPERAENRAKEFGVPRVYTPEQFYKDEDIELVVNLTPPKVHTEVELLALNAGKHIYTEKPFGVKREDAEKVMKLAAEKGLMAGGAPETFLGGGFQTIRKILDEGIIGRPVSIMGFMLGHGPENWHPDPEFFYQTGGGPMFDMGPYYITCMVNLLGPIAKVAGATAISFPQRMITSKPKYGKMMDVEIPTFISGSLTFKSGAIGTLVTSFDTWASGFTNRLEVHGSEGTIQIPDPNGFGGVVKYKRFDMDDWKEVPLQFPYVVNTRGIGVSDMCRVILNGGGKSRVDASMPFHVLDVMQSLHESAATDRIITLSSTCERPEPFPLGLKEGEVELGQ